MGWAGFLYACILWPALLMCFATKRYAVIAAIIALKWVAFIAPVREQLHWNNHYFGDDPAYFMAVYTATAVLIILLCEFDKLWKITMGLLGLSLIFSYSPYASNRVTLHVAFITAEFFGYLQILAMYGASGGILARKLVSFSDGSRWASFMVDDRISNPTVPIALYNKFIQKEAKR